MRHIAFTALYCIMLCLHLSHDALAVCCLLPSIHLSATSYLCSRLSTFNSLLHYLLFPVTGRCHLCTFMFFHNFVSSLTCDQSSSSMQLHSCNFELSLSYFYDLHHCPALPDTPPPSALSPRYPPHSSHSHLHLPPLALNPPQSNCRTL